MNATIILLRIKLNRKLDIPQHQRVRCVSKTETVFFYFIRDKFQGMSEEETQNLQKMRRMREEEKLN